MGHVLVEHNTVEHDAVFEETTWNLLDLGVALNVNLDEISLLSVDGLDRLDSQVDDQVAPLGGELGADAGADDLLEVSFVLDVDGLAKGLGDADDLVEGLEVGIDDHGRVDFALKETFHGGHDLTGQDDD